MDRGIWITWYDLPDDGREAYLSWLHETYIPGFLQRPGYLWAAHYASLKREAVKGVGRGIERKHNISLAGVPSGDQYILMFGAEHAHVFGNPVPSALNAGLPDADRKMLAMRTGERVNIMVEAARVDGPEAKNYQGGLAPAPCIQLGSFNCAWQDEEEVMAWYAQSRMRGMATLPGTVRTRALASVAGWAKHGILYEYVSLEARNEHSHELEAGRPDMKAWADRTVTKLAHATGAGGVNACRIWPLPG